MVQAKLKADPICIQSFLAIPCKVDLKLVVLKSHYVLFKQIYFH